jgi:hypothetical protein
MRSFGVALAARNLRNEAIWQPMRKMAKRTQFGINHFIINSLLPLRGQGNIANASEGQSCDVRIFGVSLAARDCGTKPFGSRCGKWRNEPNFSLTGDPSKNPTQTGTACCTAVPAHKKRRERQHLQCSAAWVGFERKQLIR